MYIKDKKVLNIFFFSSQYLYFTRNIFIYLFFFKICREISWENFFFQKKIFFLFPLFNLKKFLFIYLDDYFTN